MKYFDWLLIGLFSVVILYFMTTTMAGMSNPSYSQSIAMLGGTNNTLTHSIDSTYGVSLSNATLTCGSGNYTTNATTVTLINGKSCVNGTYSFNYYWQVPVTIFGIDYTFVAVLVFLGFALYIAWRLTK
jgi:hypothetical protein